MKEALTKVVLILILLEVTIGVPLPAMRQGGGIMVLILILLEVTIGDKNKIMEAYNGFRSVLILILLEVTIGVKGLMLLCAILIGLNPYSTGSDYRSLIRLQSPRKKQKSLNPYSTGSDYRRLPLYLIYSVCT